MGDPDDHYLVYGGRLVRRRRTGRRLRDRRVRPGQRWVTRAASTGRRTTNRRLDELDPCGEDRLCLLDGARLGDDGGRHGRRGERRGPGVAASRPPGADACSCRSATSVLVRRDQLRRRVVAARRGRQGAGRAGTGPRCASTAATCCRSAGRSRRSSADSSVAGVGAPQRRGDGVGPVAGGPGRDVLVELRGDRLHGATRTSCVWRFADG